jgi:DNA polymerase III delta' subunit
MRNYFPSIYENARARATLGASIENNTLSHALLIVGPEGSGKSTLAREISMALNCEKGDKAEYPLPCGFCHACRRIKEGNFTDIKYLEKQKERATIGVEAVKDFREDMFLSATESDKKIYIIDEAHTMTPEAQNALLKVLEEPPRGVVIMLLCSEPDRILTTIKSRCQLITMERLSDEALENYLLEYSVEARGERNDDPSAFRAMLLAADGVIGNALRLVSKRGCEEILAERECVVRFLWAMAGRIKYSALYEAVGLLPQKSRVELTETIEEIIKAVRDLVVIRTSQGQGRLLFFTRRDEAEELSRAIGMKRLLKIERVMCSAISLNSMNANIQSVLSSITAELSKEEN